MDAPRVACSAPASSVVVDSCSTGRSTGVAPGTAIGIWGGGRARFLSSTERRDSFQADADTDVSQRASAHR